MLRCIYSIVLFLILTGFSFINDDGLPTLNSSRIAITSEALVGLKLTIDNDFVIISQSDLLGANPSSIAADKQALKRLEKVVLDIDSGIHTVIISGPIKPLLRVKFNLTSGQTKYLRLRR